MDYDEAMAGLLDGTLHVPIYTTRGYLVQCLAMLAVWSVWCALIGYVFGVNWGW